MKPNELRSVSVSEFITAVSSYSPLDSLSTIVGGMSASKVSEVFVEEEDKTGVISVIDILRAGGNLDTKLSTLIHYIPRLSLSNTVGECAALMHEYRLRSVPIYRGKKLAGQITAKAVVEKLFDSDLHVRSSNLMTPNPILIEAGDELDKARNLMVRRRIDHLPVMKSGKLSGIITSADIVMGLTPRADRSVMDRWQGGRLSTPVGIVASEDVVTNEIDEPTRSVYNNIAQRQSNYSVIMNVGEIQGIITWRDLMKPLIAQDYSSQIPMYIVGLPDDPFEAETARMKFTRAINMLRRELPQITEARAVIKTGETTSPKKKYQVQVFIGSPRDHFSYRVFSYELADAFDRVDAWIKKLTTQTPRRRTRRTREDPGYSR